MNPGLLLRVGGLALLAALTSASAPAPVSLHPTPITVTVFKDPNCGCCKAWVEHLRKHAFAVIAKDTSDLSGIKSAARVPEQLHSCHTAFVDGYVVEGHVPAADIQRLLKEKPKVAGIAVPGMPVGSPGMEIGTRKDRYDVIAFSRDGSTTRFASH
ncbi:MAG: DUF411 domain-containing protein [Gemmatimonadaceae bacterium]